MASAGENEKFASLSSKQSLLENRDILPIIVLQRSWIAGDS